MQTSYFKSRLLRAPEYERFIATDIGREIGRFTTPFLHAIEGFTNSEVFNRRAGRAKALEMHQGKHYAHFSKLHNNAGLRALDEAILSLKSVINSHPEGFEGKVSKRARAQAMGEAELIVQNELLEMDILPEESQEVWVEFQKMKAIAIDKGSRGLMDHLVLSMGKLQKGRKDLRQGRKKASPLAWWKYFAIAGLAAIIGVSFGAMFTILRGETGTWFHPYIMNLIGQIRDLINTGC